MERWNAVMALEGTRFENKTYHLDMYQQVTVNYDLKSSDSNTTRTNAKSAGLARCVYVFVYIQRPGLPVRQTSPLVRGFKTLRQLGQGLVVFF